MKNRLISSLASVLLFAGAAVAADKHEDHGNTVAVTSKTWEAEVIKSDKPVLVDFWAPWCGPCMKLGPHVVSLSKKNTGVKFVKVNFDDNEELVKSFKIEAIPHLIVFSGGKKVAETEGYMDEAELSKFVDAAVKKAK
jgi:thioredoxin 1